MLLRRVIDHVKTQNWTAVALDFVIVVVGVFIGIQVSNWNSAQGERRDESRILQRLYEEVAALTDVTVEERRALQSRVDPLLSAHPILFSEDPARPLTTAECEAIAGSHVYRRASDDIPILDELIETGRFNVLRDNRIKVQLREYVLFRERQRANHDERTNELFRLYSRHPAAFAMSRQQIDGGYNGAWTWLSGDGYRWRVQCNVEEMRASQPFLNEYFDNSARNGQVLVAYEERTAHLNGLKASLGALLGQPTTEGEARQ